MTAETSSDDIRRRMAHVRRDLDDAVADLVNTAKTLTDWRHYVRKMPMLAVGAAALLGFLIVPGGTARVAVQAARTIPVAARSTWLRGLFVSGAAAVGNVILKSAMQKLTARAADRLHSHNGAGARETGDQRTL